MVASILVPRWTLQGTNAGPGGEETLFARSTERQFPGDNRELVSKEDYEPGGEFRCELFFVCFSKPITNTARQLSSSFECNMRIREEKRDGPMEQGG